MDVSIHREDSFMLAERLHSASVARFSSRPDTRPSTVLDHWALRALQRIVAGAPIRFVLWDDFSVGPPEIEPVAIILLKNRATLFSWFRDPELNFGETYMCGAIEIRGDLRELLRAIYRALPESNRRARDGRDVHDVHSSRHNVHAHYDLGNDFYRLWLDEQMLYTCAFFPQPDATLDAAQIAKMDRVCRKLWLQPGDRVFEAGCGWGALALHMARTYGARVTACNISHEQIVYARERAAREGLAGQVEFVEDDYRNVRGSFDVFASIGMLEHVGLDQYETLGALIHRSLGPGGRGLLHFIGRDWHEPLNAWIRRRIFPGAYPPTLHEVCERVFEPARLSVLDVENLRPHYARTLCHWFDRFESHASDVAAMFDDTFVRAWRLYLAGSQVAFETGSMQLFQMLFTPRGNTAIPWIRPV
jgi:cyclopropane-fatty-acyl-phospholipid synthase